MIVESYYAQSSPFGVAWHGASGCTLGIPLTCAECQCQTGQTVPCKLPRLGVRSFGSDGCLIDDASMSAAPNSAFLAGFVDLIRATNSRVGRIARLTMSIEGIPR